VGDALFIAGAAGPSTGSWFTERFPHRYERLGTYGTTVAGHTPRGTPSLPTTGGCATLPARLQAQPPTNLNPAEHQGQPSAEQRVQQRAPPRTGNPSADQPLRQGAPTQRGEVTSRAGNQISVALHCFRKHPCVAWSPNPFTSLYRCDRHCLRPRGGVLPPSAAGTDNHVCVPAPDVQVLAQEVAALQADITRYRTELRQILDEFLTPSTRNGVRVSITCSETGTTVVPSTCCNEGSTAVNYGTPRCRPPAGHRQSPGRTDSFPNSQPKTGLGSRMAPMLGPKVRGSPAARVSRRVGAGGVAGPGHGSLSFSRRVLHMDPCPWPAPRQARRRDGIPTPPHLSADENQSMIISTLYLPETTGNVRHQHVPARSVCAGYTNCPDMTGTVRQRILVIASSQVCVLH
jgi:hypothetical protein